MAEVNFDVGWSYAALVFPELWHKSPTGYFFLEDSTYISFEFCQISKDDSGCLHKMW